MSTDTTPQNAPARTPPTVTVEVMWGSITAAATGIHAVGHYRGVLPQNAELALDKAVSADGELVITDLTRRGVIRGAIGDVTFIPWDDKRMVAVAGMGAPGTFGVPQLGELVCSLATTVGRLPGCRELTTLIIGSGAGTLTIAESIRGYLDGISAAFGAYPALGLTHIRFVEMCLDRAVVALRALEEEATAANREVRFEINKELQQAPGGQVPVTFSYSLLLAAVARESGAEGSELHPWLKTLLAAIPETPQTAGTNGGATASEPSSQGSGVIAEMRRQAKEYSDLRRLALCFPIAQPAVQPPVEVASRIVFSFDGRHVRTSAITETTTVSEREVVVRQELLDEIVSLLGRSNGMDASESAELAKFAFTRLLHRDMDALFREKRSTIIDLTRSIASLPFEMLIPQDVDASGAPEPLGVRLALARQLRTSYSPPPVSAPDRGVKCALVIGDPGEGQYALPEARLEAAHVRDVLAAANIKTTLLVGSPRDVTGSMPPNALPASMVTVQRLLHNGVDLVHYCGHGVYDAERPDLAGWVFGDGAVLTADDLRQIRQAPLLVVANACISTRFSERTTGSRRRPSARATRPKGTIAAEAGLIPGLADEFFRQGVRDFVGAAFTVPDQRAKEFASIFYNAVLKERQPLGEAVRVSRKSLYEAWKKTPLEERSKELNVSPTWGAYQHYGDPTRQFAK